MIRLQAAPLLLVFTVEPLIELLFIAQIRLQGGKTLSGGVELLLGQAKAPQGVLQGCRCQLHDANVGRGGNGPHGLRSHQPIFAHAALQGEGTEGTVVVEALDAVEFEIRVKLISHIRRVAVHVAAEIVQHLQIGNALKAEAGAELHGRFVDARRQSVQILDVQPPGELHEGALDFPAVFIHDLHGPGSGNDPGHPQQIRHGAHGGVAAVQPPALGDLCRGEVHGDGAAKGLKLILQLNAHFRLEFLSQVRREKLPDGVKEIERVDPLAVFALTGGHFQELIDVICRIVGQLYRLVGLGMYQCQGRSDLVPEMLKSGPGDFVVLQRSGGQGGIQRLPEGLLNLKNLFLGEQAVDLFPLVVVQGQGHPLGKSRAEILSLSEFVPAYVENQGAALLLQTVQGSGDVGVVLQQGVVIP